MTPHFNLCLCPCLPLSVCLSPVFICMYVCMYVSSFQSASNSICLSDLALPSEFMPMSSCMCLSVCLSFPISSADVCLSLRLFLIPHLCLTPHFHLRLSPCLPVCVCLSVFPHFRLYICRPLFNSVCLITPCLSVYLCGACLSFLIFVCLRECICVSPPPVCF